MVGVGAEGVGTLANATVAFLLAIFALVCLCALRLRGDRVPQAHYTAPTLILGVGVAVNAALLLYVLGADVVALSTGRIPARQSVVLVCIVMLAVGLVLYFINQGLARLDAARGARAGTADGPVSS